jgi:Uma2 family endonuclease
MTQTLENSLNLVEEEQHFYRPGITWESFQAIQKAFENVPGVRLFYCEGVLEIVTISKPHEAIASLMGLLLGQYFLEQGIEFFPSGRYSQIIPGIVEYQADLSYCFQIDKSRPDLCIEIVITRFWEDGTLEIYCLREQEYEKVNNSELLPKLDLSLLNRY